MKGLASLILGIFGTFSFSWIGLILIPNYQIGNLNPQMDEEGSDVYPAPKSGMVERGRRIYIANGCVYCHSEQVRPYYAAGDIDRKWGERRSAPRDYIFDRPVLLGKERMGPDLANVGKRAPAEGEPPNAANAAVAAPTGGASPVPTAPSPGQSPAPPPSAGQSPAAKPLAGAPPGQSPAAQPSPPAPLPRQSPSGSPPAPAAAAPEQTPPASSVASNPPSPPSGESPPYSAAWHHRHLYAPRSVTLDSNMPSFRFLYEKRPIGSEPAANAVQLSATEAPPVGWEVVPTYDAECLVAYLMSLDQSHPLKEVKSAGAPAPAAGASPAAPAGGAPSPPQAQLPKK